MKRILLIGGGHAHLSVLQDFARNPLPDTDVTLITPQPFQWYSGMLPGLIAGHYQPDECRIDLRPLAKKAGMRLVIDSVMGMDADRQCVCLPNGTHFDYDLLSLDVGSGTDTSWFTTSQQPVLPIKPLDEFVQHWNHFLSTPASQSPCQLAVIGAGAAGIELALAAAFALPSASVHLVGTSSGLLPGHGTRVINQVSRVLDDAGVTFHPHQATATEDGLLLSSGALLKIACTLAATGGTAHEWLQLSKLELDSAGFVSVDANHRSLSHDNIFAVGDTCSRQDRVLAKSGVHAVHSGPILAHNVRALCLGYPLKSYDAKKRSLYLLSCGAKYGIMSWGAFSTSGAWVWKWKNHIDKHFIQRFS